MKTARNDLGVTSNPITLESYDLYIFLTLRIWNHVLISVNFRVMPKTKWQLKYTNENP